MVSAISSGISHAFQPITNVLSRALTPPGSGSQPPAPDINIPPPLTPAQQPSGAKPAKRSMQQTFLSSAAGVGQQQGGGGKTLLGQ